MPKNIQSELNESKDIADVAKSQKAPCYVEELSTNVVDKQRLMVERANNTFQELCQTLESEQTKLFELEERRKKLQEEMLLLKAEIEEEKQSFDSNIIKSVSKNLTALNNIKSDENTKVSLYSCFEEPDTARGGSTKNNQDSQNEAISVEDHVHYIHSELQDVLTQCITEQCVD